MKKPPATKGDYRYCCCRFTFGPATCDPCSRTYHGACNHPRLAELKAERKTLANKGVSSSRKPKVLETKDISEVSAAS